MSTKKSTRTRINTKACTVLLVALFSVACRIAAQPDLIVTDLEVTSYNDSNIYYSYTIKNVGDEPAVMEGPTASDLDNVSVQAVMSADQIFNNAGDIPAGGTVVSMSPVEDLNPGESLSGSFSCGCSVDPLTRPYLILMVDWGGVVVESDESNNTLATLIDASGDADIGVAPLNLDFGEVDLDAAGSLVVTISNEGGASLKIDDIGLQSGSSADLYILDAPALPLSLDASESVDVTVAYAPTSVDNAAGVLEIVSDDPDEPLIEVALQGAGVAVDEQDTPVGDDVTVDLKDKRKPVKKKVAVKFDKVLAAGKTTLAIKKPSAKEVLPANKKLGEPEELLEIKTTAEFEGMVELAIDYSDKVFMGSEAKLKVLHKKQDGSWEDVTEKVVLLEKVIIAKTTSFSDFGVFEVDTFGLINGLINDVLVLNLQNGIQNSLDAKLNAVLGAVDDYNAYNDIAAINTLEAFIAAVQAQRGNKIPAADADALIARAQEIIAVLGTP